MVAWLVGVAVPPKAAYLAVPESIKYLALGPAVLLILVTSKYTTVYYICAMVISPNELCTKMVML